MKYNERVCCSIVLSSLVFSKIFLGQFPGRVSGETYQKHSGVKIKYVDLQCVSSKICGVSLEYTSVCPLDKKVGTSVLNFLFEPLLH